MAEEDEVVDGWTVLVCVLGTLSEALVVTFALRTEFELWDGSEMGSVIWLQVAP
jgi:hypothetical protein